MPRLDVPELLLGGGVDLDANTFAGWGGWVGGWVLVWWWSVREVREMRDDVCGRVLMCGAVCCCVLKRVDMC